MKVFVGIFIAALGAIAAAAQETPQPAVRAAPAQAAKVIAELAASRINPVKNSPFSGEEVNESVQTLADGNRITHNSTTKIYRNSEGRTRRENKAGFGGALGFSYTLAPGVSIVDPVIQQKYELDAQLKTARVYDLKAVEGALTTATGELRASQETLAKLKAEGKLTGTLEGKATDELITKLKAEGRLDKLNVAIAPPSGVMAVTVDGTGPYAIGMAAGMKSRYESRTEDLGTRDFEGVAAEGTRRITTIPAGAVGNERPIEIVYERWFSKDLGLVVYSKTEDPRFGEQTYKLTNIVRNEPDPSLFNVPTEYRKIGTSGSTYRVSPTRAEAVRTVASPRAATTVNAVGKPN